VVEEPVIISVLEDVLTHWSSSHCYSWCFLEVRVVEEEVLQKEVEVQIQEDQEVLAVVAVQQPPPCIAGSIAHMPHIRLEFISTLAE
jgi:hypothetical protein